MSALFSRFPSCLNKQQGNALLSFVMGLVVGLGLALAVAIYITKVPVPFMNKANPVRTAEHDAAELKKNKSWDLNAPLQGKNPAKPAPMAEEVVVASPAPKVPKEPGKLAPTADPIGDLVKAKTQNQPAPIQASAPSSTQSQAEPFTYFIQVGAYRTPEDAEQQRAKVQLLGFQTKVSEREQSGRMVYRVRLGPFEAKEEANKIREKLEAASIEATVVRIQK